MPSFFRRFAIDQRGVTAVEYALIICLIGSVAIGALTNLGQTLFNTSGPIANGLK